MAPILERRQMMGPDNKPMLIGLILGSVLLACVVLAIVARDIMKKRAMSMTKPTIQISDISRPRTSHRRDDSVLAMFPGSGPFLRINTEDSPITSPGRAYFSPTSPQTPSREHLIFANGDRFTPASSSETLHSIHSPTPPPPYTTKPSQNMRSSSSTEQPPPISDDQPVAQKVLQPFNALFHDELSVRTGESLVVNRTFSDGWCLVGRIVGDYETEAGVIPAWCFQEPTGYRPQRPTRSKSLRKERRFSHSWIHH